MGPVIDASLYWIDEPAEIGFGRVCDYLVARGLESRFDYAGKEHAYFVTSSRQPSRSEKTRASRTSPPKIGVTYNWISNEASERGDHPSIGAYWDDDTLPDTPPHEREQQGSREYHFFTHLCRALNPLYAELADEHFVACAYDISRAHQQYVPTTIYVRSLLLGDQAQAFWSTYAYSEMLGEGAYGTDIMYWNPRRKGSRFLASPPQVRGDIFRAAVHRAYRAHFGQ